MFKLLIKKNPKFEPDTFEKKAVLCVTQHLLLLTKFMSTHIEPHSTRKSFQRIRIIQYIYEITFSVLLKGSNGVNVTHSQITPILPTENPPRKIQAFFSDLLRSIFCLKN
jgi:hypothetical protein